MAQSLFQEKDSTMANMLASAEFQLGKILSKIAKLEAKICAQVFMPDQELFTVIVCHPKADEDLKAEVRKRVSRQNILFLTQQDHPVFDAQGGAFLGSPSELLLDNDGFGGVMKSLLASNYVKILWGNQPPQELQVGVLPAPHVRHPRANQHADSGARRGLQQSGHLRVLPVSQLGSAGGAVEESLRGATDLRGEPNPGKVDSPILGVRVSVVDRVYPEFPGVTKLRGLPGFQVFAVLRPALPLPTAGL